MKDGRTSERQSSHEENTRHKKSAVWVVPRRVHLVFNYCTKGAAIQRGWGWTCFHKPTYSFLGNFTLGLKVNSRKAVYGIQSQRQLQECLKGPYLKMRYCGYLLAIIYT